MKPIKLALTAAFVSLGASSMLAQTAAPGADPVAMITATEPAGIVAEMQKLGYRAELTTAKNGDPRIASAAGGSTLNVDFYGCDDTNKGCSSLMFSAAFDVKGGLDMAVVNNWNAEKRYCKAYLDDERDPFLEMDIAMDGGMSAELFARNLSIWDNTLSDFKTHIGW